MSQPFIDRIMVGKPQTYGQKEAKHPMDRAWRSGIEKHTVEGKVWAGKTNLHGDGQGDLKRHGGIEKAIFVYPVAHYPVWQEKLQRTDFTIGAFGENLAVQNFMEADLCIGDTFQIGEAILQVSQPRRPCWRPARRWRIKTLAIQIQEEGMTGWYFRVLKEGEIQAGDYFQLKKRPYPEWTIAKCNDVMYNQKQDLKLAAKLAACELLAPSWRDTLYKRAQGKKKSDHNRIIGPNE